MAFPFNGKIPTIGMQRNRDFFHYESNINEIFERIFDDTYYLLATVYKALGNKTDLSTSELHFEL